MAKKLSKFESAFASARKGGKSEFDFGGKKYNTKLKGTFKKKSSKLPESTSVMPKSRSGAISSMSKKPSFSDLSNVAKEGAVKKTSLPKPSFAKLKTRTPAERDIARSKAYITNHTEKPKKSSGPSFRDAMKKVSRSIKMGSKG